MILACLFLIGIIFYILNSIENKIKDIKWAVRTMDSHRQEDIANLDSDIASMAFRVSQLETASEDGQ